MQQAKSKKHSEILSATIDHTKGDIGAEVASWLKTEYNSMKSARYQYQKQWEYNLLMVGGKQWAQMVYGGRIETPKAPAHRIRSTTNLLRPIMRMEMTRMNNQKPSASVVPVSGSDDDMFAAQAGEAVWESLYSRKRLHQLGIRNSFWVTTTGNGFEKVWWDPAKMDKSFLTIDPKLARPIPTPGDIDFGVITPFNLFIPDPLIEEIEDQPYVFEIYTKTAEWVNQVWKDKLDAPVVPSIVGRYEVFDSAYFNSNGTSAEAVPDSVLVTEAYVKPGAHRCLPNGGMVTMVGDTIVQLTDGLPYSHGEYPHAHTKAISTGKFYADSVFVDAIPLQKEYNRTRSQIIESKIRMSRPQLMYFEGSVDPRRMTSRPGEMIPVKPGYQMPTPLPGQEIPAYVQNELALIQSDLENMTGQHSVSKGAGPGGGIVAATAINFLQEQDDSLMYVVYASIEASYEKLARQALSIVADYWDLPKIIRTVGTDGAFDSVELKGSDIANGLDIRVEAGSSLPTSRAARQAFLMDLMKFGAITPEQMLDLVDIGGVKKLTELIRIDMKAAQRENLKMKKLDPNQIMMTDQMYELSKLPDANGVVNPDTIGSDGMTLQRPPMVPVNEWDNHKVHIEVHNRFRKSQEFELLQPAVKEEFQKHILHHQVMVSMDESRKMMMAAGMGGTPGPGPDQMDQQQPGADMMSPDQQQLPGDAPPDGNAPPEMAQAGGGV